MGMPQLASPHNLRLTFVDGKSQPCINSITMIGPGDGHKACSTCSEKVNSGGRSHPNREQYSKKKYQLPFI